MEAFHLSIYKVDQFFILIKIEKPLLIFHLSDGLGGQHFIYL